MIAPALLALMNAISPVPECTQCGACCLADDQGASTFVDLTQADKDRLPLKYRLHVLSQHGGYFSLKTKTNGVQTRCVALRGTVFKATKCDVYSRRPMVCRRFRPGSAGCRRALQDAGWVAPK